MPDSFTDIKSLESALKDGWIILTPNHRTAVQAHENYGAHLKLNAKSSVIPSPKIFPIDIWLKDLSQQLILDVDELEANTVLESYQELSLWKKIIRESEISTPLLNLENAAPRVLEAYRLMTQWQISLTSLKAYQSKIDTSEYLDDCTVYLHWAERYREYCRHEKLISFSELLQNMLPQFESEFINLPHKVILLGFAKPPPLYQALFDLMENKIDVQNLQWQLMQPSVKKQSYSDDAIEIKAAANWSKAILAKNPDAKVGIISNQIHKQHSLFHNIFQSTFESINESSTPYFIASTNSFSKDFPILLEITELLKFNQENLPTLELCHLLRSPLLLAQEEENSRAVLEMNLRENSQTQMRSSQLRTLLTQAENGWFSPLLAQALQNCETLRRQQKYTQNIIVWADFFTQQLEYLVWPSGDLKQKQSFIIYCWQQILADFKKLSFLYDALTFNQAFAVLKLQIQNFKYNENRQEASIQIFSPNDATGLRFTHLWFLGLSDLQWPMHQYSNPYIPLALQRKLMLPDSSPKLTHEAAIDLLFELKANTSEELIFSYSRANDAGELLPTPLISLLSPETDFEDKTSSDNSMQLHPLSLEGFSDSAGDELTELLEDSTTVKINPSENLKGGISLISNQSECPFKAFSIHRLKAYELPELRFGIPAKDIGTMLHLVLEHFWKNMKTQEAITNTNPDKLTQMIEVSSEVGIEYLRKKHTHLVRPNYALLEKQRLSKLIRKWLEQENLRSTFEVVAQEHKVQWQYADLKLNFKIDRIDKSKGSFVLIDYKSGSVKSEISDEARPSDPQLMLYSDALGQEDKFKPINALLYAQVNIDSPSYHGVSLNNETFPKTALSEHRKISESYSWEELKLHWQAVLSNIAQEFLDGYVAVDPKAAKSCQYCHLTSFCRINEQQHEGVNTPYD
ncbi:MAG: PD-(D/E)XK nuclease family protein [Gammaproteobacteria bacterium]|jgi:ATP-dependent helicase/nuclease subunit B|nr:PD-(D/E)XK nuclease family protein [Gammaproteobacteria bacterium]